MMTIEGSTLARRRDEPRFFKLQKLFGNAKREFSLSQNAVSPISEKSDNPTLGEASSESGSAASRANSTLITLDGEARSESDSSSTPTEDQSMTSDSTVQERSIHEEDRPNSNPSDPEHHTIHASNVPASNALSRSVQQAYSSLEHSPEAPSGDLHGELAKAALASDKKEIPVGLQDPCKDDVRTETKDINISCNCGRKIYSLPTKERGTINIKFSDNDSSLCPTPPLLKSSAPRLVEIKVPEIESTAKSPVFLSSFSESMRRGLASPANNQSFSNTAQKQSKDQDQQRPSTVAPSLNRKEAGFASVRRMEDYAQFFGSRRRADRSDPSRPRTIGSGTAVFSTWSFGHLRSAAAVAKPSDRDTADFADNAENRSASAYPFGQQQEDGGQFSDFTRSQGRRGLAENFRDDLEEDFLDDPALGGLALQPKSAKKTTTTTTVGRHRHPTRQSHHHVKSKSKSPKRSQSPFYDMPERRRNATLHRGEGLSEPEGSFTMKKRMNPIYSSMPRLNGSSHQEWTPPQGPRAAYSWGHLGPARYQQGLHSLYPSEDPMLRSIFPYTTLCGRKTALRYPTMPAAPSVAAVQPSSQFSFRKMPQGYQKYLGNHSTSRRRAYNTGRKNPQPRIYEIFADESGVDSDISFNRHHSPNSTHQHQHHPSSAQQVPQPGNNSMPPMFFVPRFGPPQPQAFEPTFGDPSAPWNYPRAQSMPNFDMPDPSRPNFDMPDPMVAVDLETKRRDRRTRNCTLGWMLALTAFIILALAIALFVQVSKDSNELGKLRTAVAEAAGHSSEFRFEN